MKIVERTWAPQSMRFLVSWPGTDVDGQVFSSLLAAQAAMESEWHGMLPDSRPDPETDFGVRQEDKPSSTLGGLDL